MASKHSELKLEVEIRVGERFTKNLLQQDKHIGTKEILTPQTYRLKTGALRDEVGQGRGNPLKRLTKSWGRGKNKEK